MADVSEGVGLTTRRRRRGGVSLATRLAGAVLALSLVALAVATFVGLNAGFGLGREIYEQRLVTLADAGGFDVSAQLDGLRSANESLAISPEAATAVGDLSAAFDRLAGSVTIDADLLTDDLIAAYEDTYLADASTGVPLTIGELVPREPGALYLQRRYAVEVVDVETGQPIVGEPGEDRIVEIRPVDDPGRLDDAGDGTDWSAVHAEVHPVYRRAVDELGLLDLYLVEPADARVVYSVEKRPDLGTSLVGGPFGGTVLANTVNAVIEDPAGGSRISDIRTYGAAPGANVGVIATPILTDGELAGVVAMMYDAADLTALLDPTSVTDESDFSEAADVYLVGTDGTLRSDPHSFLRDPVAYLDSSEEAGQITAEERAEIEAAGSTVLIQQAAGATVIAGAAGDDSIERRTSVSGADALNVVGALPTDGLGWYVVAEVGFDAAQQSLTDFGNILIVGTSLFVIAIAFFAVAWATRVVRPVRMISDRLGSGDITTDELVIPEQSPVEMHHLADSFRSMAATLDAQHTSLALAREERLELMRRMLPDAVATRLANGELDAVDEVPSASVAVVVVLGLGELVRRNLGSQHDVVDRLHGELDDVAEANGLDRVKVVGDAYFAACGHDRPFIDHAPRVVGFAIQARDAVRSIGREVGVDLDVAVGVHTGSVSVGMTGGNRLVYDVWGPTVTTAHHLARRARGGDVIVSEATRSTLPDDIECERLDGDDADIWRVTSTTAGTLR